MESETKAIRQGGGQTVGYPDLSIVLDRPKYLVHGTLSEIVTNYLVHKIYNTFKQF